MQPAGGTEIQYAYLRKYVDPLLLDAVQITTSIPEKEPLHPIKPNILWLKNSYDQPNLYPWFKDKGNHHKYDWYVFNSHWSYEKYRMFFDIPDNRSVVIKNGLDRDELVIKKDFTFTKPLKLVYISTPWRGLEVLLNSMEMIQDDKDITLDVYSSTQIYGDAFKKSNDSAYTHLYNKAKELKNVNYYGYCDHKTLLTKLPDYHINVHPSIWEETFCTSALESMAAGLVFLTTNYGAIYETCAEFPIYVPYSKDTNLLANKFKDAILEMKHTFENVDLKQSLMFQQDYCLRFYDWKWLKGYWERFLKGAIHEYKRRREEG